MSSQSNGSSTLHTAPEGSPEPRDHLYWWVFTVLWLVLGVMLFAGPIILISLYEEAEVPWTKVLSEVLGWYLWGLLLPLIRKVTLRFAFELPAEWSFTRQLYYWLGQLLIHSFFGLAFVSIYFLLERLKDALIIAVFTGSNRIDFGNWDTLRSIFMASVEHFILIYFAIVAVFQAVSFYEKYSNRDLKASRLETQLALAQLQVLKMQLHPHFLFNALNSVSALMHRDVEAADRMIAQLSDLLRLSLDKDDRHQVPLKKELQFLDRYLGIEKIRFRDRLDVDMDIDDECLDAQVPKLMLQPLVENSIRYGVAMRSAAGHVVVRARRKGNRLRLEVLDDGPGLPEGHRQSREGVGLANTRARLVQLYGEEHRFELRNGPIAGLHVYMEIPFERKRRFSQEQTH